MNQCPFCKDRYEERRVEHDHRWEGRLYIFSKVSAEACSQCGEVFFAPATLKAMDDAVAGACNPNGERCVPVFSL